MSRVLLDPRARTERNDRDGYVSPTYREYACFEIRFVNERCTQPKRRDPCRWNCRSESAPRKRSDTPSSERTTTPVGRFGFERLTVFGEYDGSNVRRGAPHLLTTSTLARRYAIFAIRTTPPSPPHRLCSTFSAHWYGKKERTQRRVRVKINIVLLLCSRILARSVWWKRSFDSVTVHKTDRTTAVFGSRLRGPNRFSFITEKKTPIVIYVSFSGSPRSYAAVIH